MSLVTLAASRRFPAETSSARSASVTSAFLAAVSSKVSLQTEVSKRQSWKGEDAQEFGTDVDAGIGQEVAEI
jgi:hypothetical protein